MKVSINKKLEMKLNMFPEETALLMLNQNFSLFSTIVHATITRNVRICIGVSLTIGSFNDISSKNKKNISIINH
jgi:hypothetical protein